MNTHLFCTVDIDVRCDIFFKTNVIKGAKFAGQRMTKKSSRHLRMIIFRIFSLTWAWLNIQIWCSFSIRNSVLRVVVCCSNVLLNELQLIRLNSEFERRFVERGVHSMWCFVVVFVCLGEVCESKQSLKCVQINYIANPIIDQSVHIIKFPNQILIWNWQINLNVISTQQTHFEIFFQNFQNFIVTIY